MTCFLPHNHTHVAGSAPCGNFLLAMCQDLWHLASDPKSYETPSFKNMDMTSLQLFGSSLLASLWILQHCSWKHCELSTNRLLKLSWGVGGGETRVNEPILQTGKSGHRKVRQHVIICHKQGSGRTKTKRQLWLPLTARWSPASTTNPSSSHHPWSPARSAHWQQESLSQLEVCVTEPF